MTMAAKGLAKLNEECGELLQVIGKRLAYYTTDDHPDGGPPLTERLEDEIADVVAACKFVAEANGLDQKRIGERGDKKLVLFRKWHKDPDNNPDGIDASALPTSFPRDVCKNCKGSGSVPRRDPMRPILDKSTCPDCNGEGTVPRIDAAEDLPRCVCGRIGSAETGWCGECDPTRYADTLEKGEEVCVPVRSTITVPIDCYLHGHGDPHDTPCECGKCSTCGKKGCSPVNHAGWHPDDERRG